VARGEIPAAALLVARHGQALSPYTVGRHTLQPDAPAVRPDAIFLVASVTKPVVVSAVMMLLERGELLLDDRVARFVPEFGVNGKDRITLRHLMTHTSGLPDMLPENEALRAEHAPLSEFVRRICALEPSFAAGTGIDYQSTGIAMLGEVVERVTGMALRDFLRREIFDPLGMHDTALGIAGLDERRVPEINVGEAALRTDWHWNSAYWRHFGAPWGGMFTTVSDFFRYMQCFLNRGHFGDTELFSPATVAAMTGDQTGGMAQIPPTVRQEQIWGLGWRLFPGVRWGYFGDLVSAGSYGHGGATGAVVWADPARQMTCILFTTEPSANSTGLLGRCSNLVAASAL
jgi:CubicO group peptidase (beta-lactamase class C family)